MEQESERIGKDTVECQIIADDAQADLAVAMPALEKAMAQVDKLDKGSITEVRGAEAVGKLEGDDWRGKDFFAVA